MRLSWNEVRARAAAFTEEWERVEHLLMLYEKMRTPLEVVAKPKRRRSRRTAGGGYGKAAR